MSLFKLVWKNMKGNMFRTLLAFLCVFGVSAFLMSAMIISRGTQDSMQKGLQRLGADILVVPYGAQTDIETALLMGKPSQIWMNENYLQTVAGISGVAAVSPQIYLQSLYQAACCSVSETFLVVYDPATDFTVTPWLQQNLGRGLNTGEVIGGADIFSPDGDGTIKLYGSKLKLVGNLNATGTGMDQTVFFTLDTANAISLASQTEAQSPLIIPQGEISSILVKVKPGVDVHTVIAPIYLKLSDVVPIASPQLFGTFRQQMDGMLGSLMVVVVLAWVLSTVLIALVFAVSANERQRQMSILRSLGATPGFIFKLLLTEGWLSAVSAAVTGSFFGALLISIFQNYFAATIKVPFLFPSELSLLMLSALNVAIALVVVTAAIIFQAARISGLEPGLGMRE